MPSPTKTSSANCKVFGIGFQKTGTSSLAAALYTLGFNVTGFFGVHDPDLSEKVYDMAYDLADRFDAAQDTPWPVLYKELDERYPDSKFILTIRATDRWIRSVVKHFKNQYIPAHEWIYGVRTAAGNEEIYIDRYETHNREVMAYFKDRPHDLLVMDITLGDGWEKLCPFLGVEIPPFPFPVQNTASAQKRMIFKRGIQYLKRKVKFNSDRSEGSQMAQGVSSTFVRDIVHYHHTMSESILKDAINITESQFLDESQFFEGSLRDFLVDRISEECFWLKRLKGIETDIDFFSYSDYQTVGSVQKLWKDTYLLVREFASNLSDDMCNMRVPEGDIYFWEVFVHLMNSGIEMRTLIRQYLKSIGIDSRGESFIDFFR